MHWTIDPFDQRINVVTGQRTNNLMNIVHKIRETAVLVYLLEH